MQDGVFEIVQSSNYTVGHAQILQEFVDEHKLNTSVRFAWHMTWVPPTDNTLRDTFPYEPNSYYSNYERYNHDRATVYLDFMSYLAAGIANQLFANAIAQIGWGNLILVWAVLMIAGVVISVPWKRKKILIR